MRTIHLKHEGDASVDGPIFQALAVGRGTADQDGASATIALRARELRSGESVGWVAARPLSQEIREGPAGVFSANRMSPAVNVEYEVVSHDGFRKSGGSRGVRSPA
jgi:hypothetical protein